MSDLAGFGAEHFDPKRWINDAVANARASGEATSLESFLVELEMKLQLHSEDIDLALEQTSRQAMEFIPVALKEVTRINTEVRKLRGESSRIASALEEAQERSGPAVLELRDLHTVSERMRGARDTLREAASLGEMFDTIDEVFATGNYRSIADSLASMKRSVAILGDVTEFQGAGPRLSLLEDRLASTVEARLAQSLSDRADASVRELVEVLRGMRRGEAIERLFLSARLPPLRLLWDQAPPALEGRPFGVWLGGVYDTILEAVQQEGAWIDSCVPDLRPSLLCQLSSGLFRHVASSLAARIEGAVSVEGGGMRGVTADQKRVEIIGACVEQSDDFLRALAPLLAAPPTPLPGGTTGPGGIGKAAGGAGGGGASVADAAHRLLESVRAALVAVAAPVAALVTDHAKIERAILSHELASIPLADSAPEIDHTVRALAAALPPAAAAVLRALDRSLPGVIGGGGAGSGGGAGVGGGVSAAGVVSAADDALAGLVGRMAQAVTAVESRIRRVLRRAAGEGPPEEGLADATRTAIELGDLNGQVLPMLWLLAGMRRRLDHLEASVRAALSDRLPGALSLAKELGAAATAQQLAGHPGLGVAPLTLSLHPPLVRSLETTLEAARGAGGGKPILAGTDARFRQLQAAVHALVQDTLLARVRSGLSGLASQPAWSDPAPPSGMAPYPLAPVTMVGEYLMGLPQQLDVLTVQPEDSDLADPSAPASADDELSAVAASWLDRVCHVAGEMYAGEVQRVGYLSPAGCAQLEADLEYFTNVLMALGVEPPAALATWQVLARIPSPEWLQASSELVEQGAVDQAAVEAVARARRL